MRNILFVAISVAAGLLSSSGCRSPKNATDSVLRGASIQSEPPIPLTGACCKDCYVNAISIKSKIASLVHIALDQPQQGEDLTTIGVFQGTIDSNNSAREFTPTQHEGWFCRAWVEGEKQYQAASLTIEEAIKAPCHEDIRLFKVKVIDPTTRDEVDPCAPSKFVPVMGSQTEICQANEENEKLYHHTAIAVPGYWDAKGNRIEDGSYFTIACMSDVAAKCVLWGYRPWGTDEMKKLYQACTRAARADYCGIGESITCKDTQIAAADGQVMKEKNPRKWVEAEWNTDGATCISSGLLRMPGCGTSDKITELHKRIKAKCPSKPFHSKVCSKLDATAPVENGSLIRTWVYEDPNGDGVKDRCTKKTKKECGIP